MLLHSPFTFIELKKIPSCTVGELIWAASRRSLGISRAGGSQSGDMVWTGQCCYSWSFTAEIMHNTNTLNFYLHSICICTCMRISWLCDVVWCLCQLTAIVLSCPEFMKGNWAYGSLITVCSAQTCKIKWSVEFLWENKWDETPSFLVLIVFACISFNIAHF